MTREEIYALAIGYRRHLHRYPEISTQEVKTRAYVESILQEFQIPYRTYGTGIIAVIGNGYPCVALRADMDALRVCENTDLPYRSAYEGVMHACGHDMHTAMLLGAALILKAGGEQWKGSIKLVFQPSEEKRPGGARLLLPHLLEPPVPGVIFGQHVFPGLPVGQIGIRSGAFFSSSDNIIFAVEGKGTHAAMPQLGSDPILAAAVLIQFYQTLLTKFRNPLTPAVLSITSIHGGSANNIIPDRVEVLGTVRTHDDGLRHRIFELINEKSPAICELYGCRFVPDMPWNGLPPLVNDPQWTARVREMASCLPLVERVVESEPLTLGEDFSVYLQEIPGVFWTLGVRSPGKTDMPPLHSPQMNPDEQAIPVGIEMLVGCCRDFFQKAQSGI